MHLYRPPDGTSGDSFTADWCQNCAKQMRCTIPSRTMALAVTDPDYPREWVEDDAGHATCTAFKPYYERKSHTRKPAQGQLTLL